MQWGPGKGSEEWKDFGSARLKKGWCCYAKPSSGTLWMAISVGQLVHDFGPDRNVEWISMKWADDIHGQQMLN